MALRGKAVVSCICLFFISNLAAVDYDFTNLEEYETKTDKKKKKKKEKDSEVAAENPQPKPKDKNQISQSDVFQLMQGETKVTAASKIEQSLKDTPGNVTVLTAYDFLNYGFFDLNEALYYQAGFFPSQDYDRRTVGSRGLFEGWNNNHYLLLMDGIPHNDNLYGTAYTSEITPVSIIKSVEIVRGPGSALYGSNATNGVIAINTLSGSDMKGQLDMRMRAGSYGTFMNSFMTGNETENFQYFLAGTYNSTQGLKYITYDDFNISGRLDASGNPVQTNVRDARQNNYLFAKIQGKNELENLMLQVHYQYWDFETGHGWFWMAPDQRESMRENRQIVSLSYKSKPASTLVQDYVVRFQNHGIDWNMRYAPDNSYAGYYPDGANEYLRTSAQDYFGRAQFTLNLPKESSILAGFESSLFYYGGDAEHTSNTDTNSAFAPYTNNVTEKQKPWFDYIDGKPVLRVAGYMQITSGKWLSKYAQLTLGGRVDSLNFKYRDITDPAIPDVSKSFSQFSPRAALVITPTPAYAIKFLAGRAFRDPSPAEMFGAHTWSLASNIKNLQPETVTTAEVISNWDVTKYLTWNASGFYTKFENQIVYSEAAVNQSTNVYTLSTMGLETELLYRLSFLSAFFNYSYAGRVNEKVNDFLVTESPTTLTWAPPHTLKFGGSYNSKHFSFSGLFMYQSAVQRRSSDLNENPDLSGAPSGFSLASRTNYGRYRTPDISAWVDIALRATWHATEYTDLAVEMKNALNQNETLIKNNMHPFDYQRNARSIYVFLRVTL